MSRHTAQPLKSDPLTIDEAQFMYNTYGTLFVVDGDALAVVIYDDYADELVNYPITIVSIE